MTTAAAAIAAAVTTVAATGVAACFATGAEVAQLAGELGIERVVERHHTGRTDEEVALAATDALWRWSRAVQPPDLVSP